MMALSWCSKDGTAFALGEGLAASVGAKGLPVIMSFGKGGSMYWPRRLAVSLRTGNFGLLYSQNWLLWNLSSCYLVYPHLVGAHCG